MTPRWPNLFIWSLVAGCAVLWAYSLARPGRAAAVAQPPTSRAATVPGDLTRLLGADPPPAPVDMAGPPAADARMQLVGVVSPAPGEQTEDGLAVISVNGQPAKVYRVGAVVDGETVLQAVEARGAKLGPRGGTTLIALRTTAVDSVASIGGRSSAAAVVAATAARAAPPSVPPMPQPAPAADGTPPPFGGPPQALGGTPQAQGEPMPRRPYTR